MTREEFTERTGLTPTSEEYQHIEAMYMAAGNMDKDEFCKEFKKHGMSRILEELFARIQGQENSINALTERHDDYIKTTAEKDIELAIFLIGKACAYDDTDFYKEAVRLIGQRAVTVHKVQAGLPLWEEDINYIDNNLK